jgi:hypothetical protein
MLDKYAVRVSGEGGDAGRSQGDAVLLVLGLFRHTDDHMSPVHDFIPEGRAKAGARAST